MVTTTTNQSPVAYISIGKNRQKIYSNNKVFMKNGQDFSIELFNPTQVTIGAKIYLNGKPISQRMIVLKPGERDFLERFIDNNNKFVFETYEVENSPEAKAAIAANGFVKVEFYQEYYPTSGTITINTNWGSSGYYPYGYPNTGSPNIMYRSTTDNPGRGFGSTFTTNGIAGSNGPAGLYSMDMNLCANDGLAQCSASLSEESQVKGIETGRVEAGAQSDQNFNTYTGTFMSTSFAVSEYQILPESMRPVELKQIRQYCPECRNRIRKQTWKFCPSCGAELD